MLSIVISISVGKSESFLQKFKTIDYNIIFHNLTQLSASAKISLETSFF